MALKLPKFRLPAIEWKSPIEDQWQQLVVRTSALGQKAGQGDHFQEVVRQLRIAIADVDGRKIKQLLSNRIGARAITLLWIEDESIRKRSLNAKSLSLLVSLQQPKLGQQPLLNLVYLYFHCFDQLDRKNIDGRINTLDCLEEVILDQLDLLPDQKVPNEHSLLHNLKRYSESLINRNAPALVVRRIKQQDIELGDYFEQIGLRGFDQGRFGNICRALYYLDVLEQLPVGQYDPVLAELEKPDVNQAAYENGLRIGHKAIEILIDRASADPGDHWRNFILNIAGDPRIASGAASYRQWWQPIGESRVEKVRGWLSREDLKLFLKAVEQYGEESGDVSLQRMFPARKKFLEGLFEQDLIKTTRLMLGTRAKYGVKRILGAEMKSSYIDLGGMSDKAVIYLNCGDFHVIQGSHSFKIWLYLDLPSRMLADYGITHLDFDDLTKKIPAEYRRENPGLPLADIRHAPTTWRNKVIEFLSDNGIQLDIENLMSPQDYNAYIQRFGMPVVNIQRN